jgi:WD40 repeat protein
MSNPVDRDNAQNPEPAANFQMKVNRPGTRHSGETCYSEDVVTLRPNRVFGTPCTKEEKGPSYVAFSPDGNEIISVNNYGAATVRNSSSGSTERKFLTGTIEHSGFEFREGKIPFRKGKIPPHTIFLGDAAFSRDRKRMATQHSFYDRTRVGGQDRGDRAFWIELWNITTGQFELSISQPDLFRRYLQPGGIAFSPNGQFFATEHWTQTGQRQITVWNLIAGTCSTLPVDQRIPPRSIMFTPDSASIIAGERGNKISVLDAQTGNLLRTFERLERGRFDNIQSIDCTLDGKLLVTTSFNGLIDIWDFQTGLLMRQIDGYLGLCKTEERDDKFGDVGTAVFMVGGHSVALISRSNVQIWNTANGRLRYTLAGSLSEFELVSSFDCAADGRRIALGYLDGTVKVWDLDDPHPYDV